MAQLFGFGGTQDFYASTPDEISKEIGLIYYRSQHGDIYPQGVDKCISICDDAKANGKKVKIHAEKTFPKYTWTFSSMNK